MKTNYNIMKRSKTNKLGIAKRMLVVLSISCFVYLLIAFTLIITDKPKIPVNSKQSISFSDAINANYDDLKPLVNHETKGDKSLSYRSYDGNATTLLILVHGSAWHGMQFHPMATHIAKLGIADVIVPDLRGHGSDPERRGDIDYIGQLEDDLSELIAYIRNENKYTKIILGGHSSGGGLTIRYAGNNSVEHVDGYLLMAPYLKYNAPTTKQNSGNWAYPASRRIAGLTMLNNVGISFFNNLPVIAFNMSDLVLEGPLGFSATTEYSFRLNTSFAPRMNYTKDISKLQKPFLLIAGKEDESFVANEYQPLMEKYTKNGEYVLLEGIDHIGVTMDTDAIEVISSWINKFSK